MDLTKIYFIVFVIFILFLSKIAKDKNNKYCLFLIIILLSLFAGLRGESVGVDTKAYYYGFNYDFSLSYEFTETGFRVISRFLLTIFKNPTMLFVIYAFIINYFIVKRLWDYRKKASFVYMIAIYLLIFYLSSMNIMRQFLAMSIIFYFSKCLEDKKYIKFIIALLIAYSIHHSAILGIIYLMYYLFRNGIKTKKSLLLFFVMITGTLVFGTGIMMKTYSKYEYYLNSTNVSLGIVTIYRLISLFLSTLFAKKIICDYKNSELKINKNGVAKSTIFFYTVGILLSSLGNVFPYLTRVGYYFILFEIIYWAELYYNKNKLISIMFPLVIIAYTVYVGIINNGWMIFPYMFYWQ